MTFPIWMPCARKHELTEERRVLKALLAGRPAAARRYVHSKGKLMIATMDSDKLATLKAEIARMREELVIRTLEITQGMEPLKIAA